MSKIDVSNMDLYYGDFHALKNINLSIDANEVTAFIGPSGCGKSTLLKSINRMNDLVPGCRITGEMLLDGENIYGGKMDVNGLRKRVGMVFQKPNPFPMSIYDNIAYGPRTHGVRSKAKLDDIVEQSLRQAAIWDEVKDRLKKSALGMSGGQQQRLCIARALAVQPEVLLMDEPTSALDPISTSKIEDLAVELKKDYTIVMVTHNMQQAARISDKTAFFLLGEVVEYGETEQIFGQRITLQGGLADMRERFEQQMEILHTELIELGALCEQAIGRTYEVLLEGNQRAAEEIIKKDQVVDAKEREIEDLCFRIILQQQPVARDLRQVSAALKMITDMERIGDQAADIADIVKVTSLDVPDASIRLKDMAKATASMVTKCIDAYVKQDLKLAREVIDSDDIVDDLFDEVKDEILQGMRKGITTDVQSLDYLMIAKYYERIGDHATNIAEWVVYSINGHHKGG